MTISGAVCAHGGRVRIWVHGGCGLSAWQLRAGELVGAHGDWVLAQPEKMAS